MTYEDALDVLINKIQIDVKFTEDFNRDYDCLTKCKEALEKQIPKKMETKKCICYDGEEREYEVCANCGTQVRFAGTMTADYCWNCGQRVL